MATPRTIGKYGFELFIIFAPLAVVIYFLFDPDAFDAFLNWLARVL